jgi:hypothetical protein
MQMRTGVLCASSPTPEVRQAKELSPQSMPSFLVSNKLPPCSEVTAWGRVKEHESAQRTTSADARRQIADAQRQRRATQVRY